MKDSEQLSSRTELSSLTAYLSVARSWINVLGVTQTTADTLTVLVEFVAPLPDGRSRWVKTVFPVSQTDYQDHFDRVLLRLVQTIEDLRASLKSNRG